MPLFVGFSMLIVTLSATPPLARGGDGPVPSCSVLIKASPAILNDGTRCRLELRAESTPSGQVTDSYTGRVIGSNSRGFFVQIEDETHRVEMRAEPKASLPFVNRRFRNVGIGRTSARADRKLWIPAEKVALIEVLPLADVQQPTP
jgi:hypothetical protein